MKFLGIDIGSTTSKCVILGDDNEIVAKSLVVGGIGTPGPQKAVDSVLREAGLDRSDIAAAACTGYGRASYKDADYQISELTCHGVGGRYVFPDLRTLIDVGGQDAKVVCLSENGIMDHFLMNDKCAAGTGRFLDVMANILQVDIDDLGKEALSSKNHVGISSTCTVFAESEVISQLANGAARNDVIAGICDSVAFRTATLAKRGGIVKPVCMSGGVAKNEGVRKALEKALDTEILYSPLCQYFGALGAAVSESRKYKK